MIVHLVEPNLIVRCDPVTGRIAAVGEARHHLPDGAIEARGIVATPSEMGFRGDWLLVDYYQLVGLETWLRTRHPHLRRATIRRRLRSMVRDEGHMSDMLRIKDSIEAGDGFPMPWVGECAWLGRECIVSVRLGTMARNRQISASPSRRINRTR